MKSRMKKRAKQMVCSFLCISMLLPNVAPIVSLAAEGIGNMPRYVDFQRPEALQIRDLRLATGSDAIDDGMAHEFIPDEGDRILSEDEIDGIVHVATDSDAELRDPEFYYDDIPEEPDGILVDFSEKSRTYLMEENVAENENGDPIHSYVTVIGESPWLYKDSDGFIRTYDNTLVPVSNRKEELRVATASNAHMATASNMRRSRSVVTVTNYQNSEGDAEIQIPDEMDHDNGYMLSNGDDTLELIPTEGEFKSSVVLDNAIRYSNVFPNVDFQYTVFGNTLKEDIILLEQQDRNEFSYKLRGTGLKFKKDGNSVVAYKNSYRDPSFRITAPVMVDAAGVPSVDIRLKFDKSDNTVTFVADKDWLDDPERAYPVRIDPGTELVGYSAFTVNMVAKGDKPGYPEDVHDENIYNQYFGDNGHTMVGYSREYGHCRAVIDINMDWASLINNSATQIEGEPGVKDVQVSFGIMTKDTPTRTPFILRIIKEAWDTSHITFAGICNKVSVQSGNEAYSDGYDSRLEFNITDSYYSWVNDGAPCYGMMLEVEGEHTFDPNELGSVWWAETIYNKTGIGNGPRIEVAWEGKLENVDMVNFPMSDFSLDVGPGVVETDAGGRSTKGILAYGASQADSKVEYGIYRKSDDELAAEGSVTAHDEVDCPDYSEVDSDCIPERYQDANWQSEPVYTDGDLEFDTIYYAKAQGFGYALEEDPETGELVRSEDQEEESAELTSDEFLLYEVQATDVVPRIARHYGITVKQLKEDNQFLEQLTEAGNVLFIRNPKTDKPYTRKLSEKDMEWLIAQCISMGYDYRDFFDQEPINMANGSFYMSQTDARIEDLGGAFNIERSYNSIAPYFRSDFGMGWNSLSAEKIMVLADGRIIYTREDGKGLIFEKDGKAYKGPDGYDYELETVSSLELITDDSTDGSEDEEKNGTEVTAEKATSSNASLKTVSYEAKAVSVSADEDSGKAAAEDEDTPEDGAGTEAVPASTGWKISQPDGTEKYFNSNGLLVTEKDRRGLTTYYVYDSSFSLKKIISPSKKEYVITQTPEGLITDIALPDGGELHYEYDDEDNLLSFTNPEGDVRSYEYDENHRMTAWYDENGTRVVENTYREDGTVETQTDALGSLSTLDCAADTTTLVDNRGNTIVYRKNENGLITEVNYANGETEKTGYTADNRVESKTDANGTTTRYTYDENGNVLTETRDDGSSASYTYNEYAQPLTATDYEGNTTRFTYDEKGNLISMTDGAGNVTGYEYDDLSRVISITDANGGTSSFTYEGTGAPVVSHTDPEGYVSTFTYDEMNRILTQTDPEGNTTSHDYNANGWELSTTAPDGGVTAYEFSPVGEVLSITDPMGVATSFTYDAMHNIISGEDALGNTLHYTYDRNYNRISEKNAKGDITSYEYDARDRVTSETDALGNPIRYTLDGNGNIIGTIDRRGNQTEAWYHKVQNMTTMTRDALGNETFYQYDNNGNPTKITYPDGTSVHYAYDHAGRLVRTTAQNGLVTEIGYDGNGNIVRITDDDTRVYRFQYDGNNRLIKATDPLGGVTEYAYDGAGNQISVTDANQNTTGYAYDAMGRLKEMQDALGGTVTSEYDLNGRTLSFTDQNAHTTAWRYDVIGQVLAQVDAAENITAMEYDSLGNVTKVIDALKGETSTEVDALSRTVKMTDALGGEYTYEYDENGNVIKITMPDEDSVSMTYDEANRMTYYRDEADVVTRYEYDSMGRITKAADTAGNIMAYEYDANGNLVKQTDTIGRDAVYDYDKFNRLVSVTGTDGASTTYAYDALDRLVSVTEADGAVTVYEYDPVGNLIKTTEPGEAVYTYAYDAIDRLTGKVNPLGASTAFQYDAKGNLTGAVDGEGNTNTYVYDVIDRLTSLTDGRGNDTVYEYDELSRLLSQTTPEGSQNEYRYDALSRMTAAKDPNGLITEYKYDVMGNLVEAISPKGARTAYTYDKHDERTSVTDPAGNVTAYAVDLNRQVTELTQKNGAKYAYTYDAVHRLTGITTPLGLERTFTYDTADNIIKDTDNLGRTTTYGYDIMHRMTKSTNAKGGVTEYAYDIRGNRSAMTDAMGYTWNYRYDLLDQLTAGVDPEGKATEAVYDLVGNITSITRPGERTTRYAYDENYNQTSVTDPKGYVYGYTYDRDNRMTGTVDPLAQTQGVAYDPGSRVTELRDKMGLTQAFTYDPHGNVLTSRATNGLITRFQYDILDELVQVTDPMGYQTSYQYDVMGNITSMTNAKQKTTAYEYDLEGNMTSLTSPMGRKEQYTYDAGGRMTERLTPSGGRIFYDYDTLNALADKSYSSANELGNDRPVQMVYNVMGQRIAMEDITGESVYTYDSLGRLKTATNGSGKVVEYYYDEADNLQEILYPDGKVVLYEYDKNDNITKLTDRDWRETTYEYDPLNRLTHVVRADGSESEYTYNARNQVLEAKNTCICGFLISDYKYTYDDAGLITKEVAKECLFKSDKDYGHNGGDKDNCAHANGSAEEGNDPWQNYWGGQDSWSYQNPWENQNPEWETTVRTFTYDDNGEMVGCEEIKDQFDKVTYTYKYDEAGNRTLAKKAKTFPYSYLESWQNTYTYNDDNQMTAATVCEGNLTKKYTFTYDANGNLTHECFGKQAEVVYQYDTENRLTAVYDQQKLLMASTYDGDGNRAFQLNYNPDAVCGYGIGWGDEIYMPEHSQNEDESLTAEGQLFSYLCSNTGRYYDLTEYVNDTNRQNTQVLTAYTINGGATESYSYAGNIRNSRNDIWSEGRGEDFDETSYYLYDGRGSVTANTWYNGMVTEVYQYDPYGQVTLGSSEHTDFYGYNAESYNPNTGLEFLRARYYNAKQGRFFQEDTYLGDIIDPLTLNRYNYVKSSPLNYTDPSGHKWTIEGLNEHLKDFEAGRIKAADLSKTILLENIANIFNGFHQIAQIHAAARIKRNTGLESKLEKAYSKKENNTCETIHVDIVAGNFAWEVKSQGFWWNVSTFTEADEQLQGYLDFTEGTTDSLQRGIPGMVGLISDIPIIGRLKMEVVADPITSGLIFYSVYYEDNGKRVPVRLAKANTEANDSLEKEKASNIVQLPGSNKDPGKVAITAGGVVVAAWALYEILKIGVTATTGIPAVLLPG